MADGYDPAALAKHIRSRRPRCKGEHAALNEQILGHWLTPSLTATSCRPRRAMAQGRDSQAHDSRGRPVPMAAIIGVVLGARLWRIVVCRKVENPCAQMAKCFGLQTASVPGSLYWTVSVAFICGWNSQVILYSPGPGGVHSKTWSAFIVPDSFLPLMVTVWTVVSLFLKNTGSPPETVNELGLNFSPSWST